MANSDDALVAEWRDMGPAAWAESDYGWVSATRQPIRLEPWQRAVLAAWWAYRETVTTLAISNIKKTGKTALNAILLTWRYPVSTSPSAMTWTSRPGASSP